MLTALLFDLDGTLTDTNRLHAEAFAESFAERGYTVPVDRILQRIGEGGPDLVRHVLGPGLSEDEAEDLSKRHTAHYLDRLQRDGATLLPGTVRLLQMAHDQGLKLGLCTSSEETELEAATRASGLDLRLFDAVTSASDVDHAKPHAEPVVTLARKLGVVTAETALVGDTPYDGLSARRAGSVLLGIRNPAHSDADLRRAGARRVYAHPDALANGFSEALDAASPGPHSLSQEVLEHLMEAALNEAEWAFQEGNLPVGAVVARRDGNIISRAGNATRQRGLDIAHAELEALLLAAPLPSRARDLVLVTTLEPCRMCLGAAFEQGLDAVVYALEAPQNGAANAMQGPESGPYVMPRLVADILRGRSRDLFARFDASPPRRASEGQRAFAESLLKSTSA